VSGLTQLKAGADQLAPGARRVSDGVNTMAGIVVPIANGVADAVPVVTQTAAAAANGAAALSGMAATAAATVAGDANSVQAKVMQLVHDHPDLAADPVYQQLVVVTGRAAGLADQVSMAAGHVRDTTAASATAANQLATDAPRLQAQARGVASRVTQLAQGAEQVAVGAATLDTGLGSAVTGATDLNTGLGKLHDGAGQLAAGLADAQKQLPALSAEQRRANAATLASPVNVAVINLHPAITYGRGLTPFFFAIALWVFGITGFLVLRPFSVRALASRTGSTAVALSGWLPAGLTCVLGGLLLFMVLDWGLGLAPVHPWQFIGLMALAAAAFSAIAHVFRVLLGTIASAVTLVLLLLQLTTCAGTYPYETLPAVFRALHPLLPMSYLVDGFRVTVTGGNPAHLVRDCLVLAGFLLAALVLTTLAVRWRRHWHIYQLKPDLSI
jgi:putative membrane protein